MFNITGKTGEVTAYDKLSATISMYSKRRKAVNENFMQKFSTLNDIMMMMRKIPKEKILMKEFQYPRWSWDSEDSLQFICPWLSYNNKQGWKKKKYKDVFMQMYIQFLTDGPLRRSKLISIFIIIIICQRVQIVWNLSSFCILWVYIVDIPFHTFETTQKSNEDTQFIK